MAGFGKLYANPINRYSGTRKKKSYWDDPANFREEAFAEPKAAGEKSPPDLTFMEGNTTFDVYFMDKGNNTLSMDVLVTNISVTKEDLYDSGDKKKLKKLQDDKTTTLYYTGSYTFAFNRWGKESGEKQAKDLTYKGSNLPPLVPEKESKISDLYRKTDKEIIDRYIKEKGLPPGIAKPEQLPEYVVIIVKDMQGLSYTYMIWNGEYGKKDPNFDPQNTKQGWVNYYEIVESNLPQGFYDKFGNVKDENAFYALMDKVISSATLIEKREGLRPASYEAYKGETLMRKMIVNGQVTDVPLKDTWGGFTPGDYKFDAQQNKYVLQNTNQVYAKLDPLFPPKSLLVSFTTNGFSVPGEIIDVGDNTRKKFLDGLEDVVTYLRFYPDVKIKIIGYTSRSGDPKSNQVLSEKRAQSTYEYIVNLKIGTDKDLFQLPTGRIISWEGKGDSDAVTEGKAANNDDAEDRKIVIQYIVSH